MATLSFIPLEKTVAVGEIMSTLKPQLPILTGGGGVWVGKPNSFLVQALLPLLEM